MLHKARTHGPDWRTAQASSIDGKKFFNISLRQLPPRLVRVLLVLYRLLLSCYVLPRLVLYPIELCIVLCYISKIVSYYVVLCWIGFHCVVAHCIVWFWDCVVLSCLVWTCIISHHFVSYCMWLGPICNCKWKSLPSLILGGTRMHYECFTILFTIGLSSVGNP